jgi:DNA-binding transcriptional ArsR family regulator
MAASAWQTTAQLEAETASLWRALADPTRRRILDMLRDGPAITGDIAEAFPISRIAVMRHLEVLAEAELITSRKRGRERWHYLNAVPLERLHRRWAGPIGSGFASGLLRLQAQVEAEGAAVDWSRPSVDVALDVVVAGSRHAVFEAITEQIGEWWGYPALDPRATGLSLEPGLGGKFVEHWGDTGGQVIATLTGMETDRHVRLTGPFHYGLAVGDATFDLDDAPGGTLLRFSFRALGPIDPAILEDIESGWTTLVASRLKALVETGSPEAAVAGESNMRAIGGRPAGPAGPGLRRRKR